MKTGIKQDPFGTFAPPPNVIDFLAAAARATVSPSPLLFTDFDVVYLTVCIPLGIASPSSRCLPLIVLRFH